jgi:hypothetical protein
VKARFQHIVNNRAWDGINRCGGGSTLAYTEQLRSHMPPLWRELGIQSMLDAPCGDFAWMSLVVDQLGCEYRGADIVPELIEHNRDHWPQYQWQELDITQDPLGSADLLFCRDCLFHLSETSIDLVVRNWLRSGIPWLVTTHYLPGHWSNCAIEDGGFRPLRMTEPPFLWPEPRYSLPDGPVDHTVRHQAVWHRADWIPL